MNRSRFNKLLDDVAHLTDEQVSRLERCLQEKDPIKEINRALEQRLIDNPECPHCHSSLINRHGTTKRTQRYRCKNCLKTFTATTKTPLARLRHKDKWNDYLHGMIKGKVLREAAKDCQINLKTSFRWRHRFLLLPAVLKPRELEGIVEADETLFLYSEKGSRDLERPARKRGMKASKPGRSSEDWVSVLTVRDRGNHTYEAVLASVSAEAITNELQGKIQKGSVLCSDGLKSYTKFSREQGLLHVQLNAAAGIRVINKVFHIQNVNAYHSRLKLWIGRFHGVATKYLENYLGWFRYLDTAREPCESGLFKLQQQLTGT